MWAALRDPQPGLEEAKPGCGQRVRAEDRGAARLLAAVMWLIELAAASQLASAHSRASVSISSNNLSDKRADTGQNSPVQPPLYRHPRPRRSYLAKPLVTGAVGTPGPRSGLVYYLANPIVLGVLSRRTRSSSAADRAAASEEHGRARRAVLQLAARGRREGNRATLRTHHRPRAAARVPPRLPESAAASDPAARCISLTCYGESGSVASSSAALFPLLAPKWRQYVELRSPWVRVTSEGTAPPIERLYVGLCNHVTPHK
ncbi:unnamed protein product [Pleuronectes platessa]|uniref:Uncharacterized protein n=1 Tax=Pleuronectes platessa TaxID=8262 RepID=A0A9N7VYM1_PLEPL|nr:unnamed protein product [Pleuronectes platessa]